MKALITSFCATAIAFASLQAQSQDPGEPFQVPESVEIELPADARFQLQVGSRLYPEWAETHRVGIGELFYLGDSEYSARVRRFFPDMRIIEGQFLNLSRDMNNPAVQIMLYEGDAVADSAWAFLNFPPHYSMRSFFSFQLTEVAGYGEGIVAEAGEE